MSSDRGKDMHESQDARRHELDHQARNRWLDGDKDLQDQWRASAMSRDEFIRHHQKMIDKRIVESANS